MILPFLAIVVFAIIVNGALAQSTTNNRVDRGDDAISASPSPSVEIEKEDAKEGETEEESSSPSVTSVREEVKNRGEITEIKQRVQEKKLEIEQRLEQKRIEIQQKAEEKRQEAKLKIDEIRRSKILKYFEQMIRRFEAAIERLSDLSGRISSRLDKFAETGKDVSSFKDQLAKIDEQIELAKLLVDESWTKAQALLNSTDVDNDLQDRFGLVREVVVGLKDKTKEIHQSLIRLITDIKGASGTPVPSLTPTPSPEATPTPSVSPSPSA